MDVNNINDIEKLYIDYCMQLCSSYDELTDKKRVKQHNRAMDALRMLEIEIFQNIDIYSDCMMRLLANKEERVRMAAAAYCLMRQIYVEDGTRVLEQIAHFSNSGYMRACASDNLKYCKPIKG